MLDVAKELGPEPASIVEPTCGRGTFLLAAHDVFPRASLVGVDKSKAHVAEAKRVLLGTGASVRVGDFFRTRWEDELEKLPTPILVLGNPPWVTSAAVGKLGGKNLPKKGWRKGHSGLESLTGKANFDISEWMMQKLLEAGVPRDARLAMLCKSTVARRLVAFIHDRGWELTGSLYRIDSRIHFEASVDAVLFVAHPAREKKDIGRFAVHDSLASAPTRTMGVIDGRVSTDTEAFLRTRDLERSEAEESELSWRSGLKHDCAAVMELALHPEGYRNGLGNPVDLEPHRVYPLLKGSDIANGRSPGLRAVVVPQRFLQEDTLELAQSAPRAYAYLRSNERALAARKSRVYEGRPPFAIFGIGPYTFARYKVAVCGLYKRLAFRLITPFEGMPVMVDDTVTFLPFDDEATATRVADALNGPLAKAFFEARVFWDEKRPIGKALLSALSIRKLLEASEPTSKPPPAFEHPRKPPMQSAILTIGTELTRGELVNTNASWLSARLTALGFDVVEQAVIADDRATIVATFERLSRNGGLVLVTGGLGPTTDDLTTACAAEAMGVPLKRDPASLEHIRARFERLKRTMNPSNEKQADFPEGAEVLQNPIGSAPGFAIYLGKAHFFFMPGVPREMKTMFDDEIAPRVEKHAKKDTFQVRLRTFGLPESHVGDRLAGLEEANPGLTIGYRANFPEVEVKVHVRAEDFTSAKARSEALAEVVRERLGDFVFGEGEETFASVVAKALVAKKLTLAVAESCTGGLVGHLLTREAGASEYLLVDAVTYANEAKTRFADVSEELLRAHGAVSPEVARAMAEGIRARSGADVGLSLTGVAGPGGGSEEKPVGTVFLAVATREGTTVKHLLFVQERTMVQAYAAHAGLDLVRRVVTTLA